MRSARAESEVPARVTWCGTDVLKLLGWLAVGVVLLALGWFKLRRDQPPGR